MNKKLLIIFSAVALFIAGCKTDVTQTPGTASQTGVTGITGSTGSTGNSSTAPYSLTETFESGTKTSYTEANVTLSTGSWDFNGALIGNLSTDPKDGNWSVRLKGPCSLGMNFDINGITQISIAHAKYGTDAASTWQLMVSTDGGTTYTNVGNAITETSTTLVTDSFKVSAAKARFKIVSSSTTRFNIDDFNFKGTGNPGVTISVTAVVPPDTASTGTAASARGVTVGTDAPPASGDNSNLLFGNPSSALAGSMASANNYLLDQGYYVESFNNAHGTPNWVSWHLDNTNTTNLAGRGNNFAAFTFPTVTGITWNVVQSNSYNYATYGFDRGHNCPSADRTSSVNANSATFLMTNMIPQSPQNNEQTWGNMENFLRTLTTQGYEVYIVMGNYGTGGTGLTGAFNSITSGSLSINVPAHVWKVAIVLPVGNGDLARVTAATRIIAVDTPNNQTLSSDWTQYITTFSTIESATGYTLFSNLPKAVHDALAQVKDSGK